MSKIEIVLNNQILEVDLNDLKGNDDALIGILAQDPTNQRMFLEFAFEYHKRGMIQEFEKFLLAGKSQAASKIGKPNDTAHRLTKTEKHLLLLNTLASFYIESAKGLQENQTLPSCNPAIADRDSSTLLRQSAELLNEAEQISKTDKFTFTGKANVILMQIKPGSANEIRELDQVFVNFKAALQTDPNFVPALIGLAGVNFQRKNFKLALQFYQKVLMIQPELIPDPRIPIGICFYKLDMKLEAGLAFKRALEIDPKNCNALMLLSLIEVNEAKSLDASVEKKSLQKSASSRSLRLANGNPSLGERFAQSMASYNVGQNYGELFVSAYKKFFIEGGGFIYQRQDCSNRGVIMTDSQRDFPEALKNFEEAAKYDPNSPLIQFQLAQVNIQKEDLESAAKCLENVLVVEAHDYDSLKLLFSIYATSPTTSEKATHQLEAIAKMNALISGKEVKFENIAEDIIVKDAILLADIAQYLEGSNVFAARKKYLQLHALLEKQKTSIPPELLNNIAVLYHIEADSINHFYQGSFQVNCRVEDVTDLNLKAALDSAQSLYEQALTKLAQETHLTAQDPERLIALQTTIRFNVARLFESKGDIKKAENTYKELLGIYPAFGECLLRLGSIEQDRGDIKAALSYYSDALAIDNHNSLAWFMIGNLHFKAKAYRAARKSFEKVLASQKYDTYALCSAGNLCLIFARGDPNEATRKLHFSRSIEYFCKVLSLEPNNLHAATGIAIAYAETAKFSEARDVFNQIQELSSGDSRMALNAGHVLVELGQYHLAVSLYENALKKGGLSNDEVVLRSLSRAFFIIAKTTKDIAAMRTARSYIQKAIHVKPSDKSLLYNLALIEQQMAQVMNDLPSEKKSIESFKGVLNDVDLSEKLFSFLASLPADASHNYDIAKAKERAMFCKAVKKASEKNIHSTEVLSRLREGRLQEIKDKKLQNEMEAIEREEASKIELKRKDLELETQRKELMLKMQEDNEKMRSSKRFADEPENEEDPKPKKSKRDAK